MKYNTQPIAEVMNQAITKLKGMKQKKVNPKTQTEIEMDKYDTLQKIVNQLEFVDYTSEQGVSIKMNVAFMKLKQMAKTQNHVNKELLEALKDCLIDVTQRCTYLKLDCTKYSTWQKATKAIKKAEL